MSILSGFKSFERYIKTNSGYQKVSERTLAKDVLLGSDGSGNSVETEITNLNENLNNLGESVADGKALVASAITDKGIETASNASFATMASNIGNISTGVKLLYVGNVSLSGYTGSSASTHIDGSVNVGAGLTGVKCAATLTDIHQGLGTSGQTWIKITGTCSYNSTTGIVSVQYKSSSSTNGFYGYGGGTAYLIVIQQ